MKQSHLLLTTEATPELQDVERAYRIKERCDTVLAAFNQPALDPYHVFRSHLATTGDHVSNREASHRAALDLLLGGLSALHMGGLGALSATHVPEAVRLDWASFLEAEPIRAYYEQHYPFAPPLLIRASFRNELPPSYRVQWCRELDQEAFLSSYRQFLHLDAHFVASDVIGDFLELIDDFYVRGDHLEDFSAALKSPSRLVRWLGAKDDRWRLIEAMASFFDFAQDLDGFLSELRLPILRGHIWLHYAYWFGVGGARMIDVANWLRESAAHIQEASSNRTAETLLVALKRLADPTCYASELLTLTEDILSPWRTATNIDLRFRLTMRRRWTDDKGEEEPA